jgi:hypothetical protein
MVYTQITEDGGLVDKGPVIDNAEEERQYPITPTAHTTMTKKTRQKRKWWTKWHLLTPTHTLQKHGLHMDIDLGNSDSCLKDEKQPNYPSSIVTAEDSIKAIRGAKNLTSGGLQQLTQCYLTGETIASYNKNFSKTAAYLATLGELVAESKLIALCRKAQDIRPISLGCALTRLLTKAYCSKLYTQISRLKLNTQLGMKKARYEIGVHAMRAMAAQAKTNGDGILLSNFTNAFNTVSRNLLISLAAKMCPEITNLTW